MLTHWFLSASAAALAFCAAQSWSQEDSRPNIVYIFADDMGWGTGQFNNPTSPVETPHLNQLAADGLNFTRHYSATVCSPSRAMLMTGFHTGNTSNDRNNNIGAGLRSEEVTVADVLRSAGYKTSVFGKWGWGGTGGNGVLRPDPLVSNATTLPQNKGFDEFYGYLSHGRAHSYQVDSLWTTVEPLDDDGDGVDEVGEKYRPGTTSGLWLEKTGNHAGNVNANYTHDLIGLKSEQYIRSNAASGEPFYMQVNYTIPHFDLEAIAGTAPLLDLDGQQIFAGGLAQYAVNVAMSDKQKKHAAMISRMDASIGSLIRRLEDPNGDGETSDSVLDNTLVLFSSDNGPTPEDGLGNVGLRNLALAGGLRGGKRDLFEGGIRSPLLARWDAQIEASRRGQSDDTLTDLTDFMATAADVAGAVTPVGVDGVSVLPRLSGVGERRGGKVVLSENFENSQTGNETADWALIRDDRKLIRFRSGAYGLYDLAADPTESSPLNLAVPENASLKAELEGIALAEGAGRGDSYFVRYAEWTGAAADASFVDAGNWSLAQTPDTTWSATVNNAAEAPRRLSVPRSTAVLGLEVRGDQGETTIDIAPGQVLTARNEVRIRSGGRVEVAAATLSTSRWVEVSAGGRVGGHGVVEGVVYNQGVIAPGREAALPPPDDTAAPLGELAPRDFDTGHVALIGFDFAGVQDDAPLIQTSELAPRLSVAEGFNFGPATFPRNAADAGDEFNVSGFSTGSTLAAALAGGNYLTFSIEADEGAGVVLDEVRFDLWRNGVNAAENYAVFTSIDGFTESSVLAQFSYPENLFGIDATQSITASPLTTEPVGGPVEVRVYGWGSNGTAGNTHFNHVSAQGRVVAIPSWELDFGGVQDTAPLSAVTPVSSTDLVITEGLEIAAGLEFSDSSDSGDEFNVEGWASGDARRDALFGRDYLSFSVQAIEGLAMVLESAAFDLWRETAGSPTGFAVMSSLGGFELASPSAGEAHVLGVGEANRESVVGVFDDSTATQEAVEFRLYGWNAASTAGNVHVDGVSLRALFQTVFDYEFDPTGVLFIDGDLHHIAGGLIDLEIGGPDASDPASAQHDRIDVDGTATIEGDIRLSLIDGYEPRVGESFELIVAEGILGEFETVFVDPIGSYLTLRVAYDGDRVLAVVAPAIDGDYNADGVVDAADYVVWRGALDRAVTPYTIADGTGDGFVDQADFEVWAANYGLNAHALARPNQVPEPSPAAAVLAGASGASVVARRKPAGSASPGAAGDREVAFEIATKPVGRSDRFESHP